MPLRLFCHLYALKDNIRIHGFGNAPSYDLAACRGPSEACKVDKAIVIGPDVGDVPVHEKASGFLFGIEMPVEDVFSALFGEVS